MSEIDNIHEHISLATSTFYNPDIESDRIRLNLAERSMRNAREMGLEVVCVDGGSPDEFLKNLESYGVRVFIQEEKGFSYSRRQAYREAANLGKRVIASMEAEKLGYIEHISKTALPILEDKADIVIPSRISLDSYPSFQQYAERLGNMFWKDLTGVKLDIWFGPKTWSKDCSRYFLDEDLSEGGKHNYNINPIMDALLEGKRVLSIDIDYQHPAEQKAIEENDLKFHKKRIDQLSSITGQLEAHWNKLHPPKVK